MLLSNKVIFTLPMLSDVSTSFPVFRDCHVLISCTAFCISVVSSPLNTWWDPTKLDDLSEHSSSEKRVNFDINRVLGSGSNTARFIPESIRDYCSKLVRKLSLFCMDDSWIPLSLVCAKLNMNFIIRVLRLPVALVALAVLMYEVSQSVNSVTSCRICTNSLLMLYGRF
jgi:hypothetical protein